MFKSAITSLSSAVVGATKETLKQYLPNVENEGDSMRKIAINTIIQGGVARLANRSPILADIAQNTFKIHQSENVKRQKASQYVKSSRADWLRPVVKDSLDPKASDKKIHDEMMAVISKISKEIDRVGVEETKNSGKFTEYEKYFDEFMSKNKEPNENGGTTTPSSHGLGEEILNRIESNTRQTVNTLESLALGGGIGIGASPNKSNPSFIDPLTGMPSIAAGIGSIGGSFLSKIFDDETIEKFAKKTKSFFINDVESEETTTAKTEPIKSTRTDQRKRGMEKTVETMFSKNMFDLDSDIRKNSIPDNKPEGEKTEIDREVKKEQSDIAKKQQETSDKILEELKHLNKTTEKKAAGKEGEASKSGEPASGKQGIVSKVLEFGKDAIMSRFGGKLLGNILPRGATKLAERIVGGQGMRVAKKLGGKVMQGGAGQAVKNIASRAVPALVRGGASIIPTVARFALPSMAGAGGALASGAALPAALVAGAGAAGYGVGKLLNPLINKGMKAMTGTESLGSWIYDKTHPEHAVSNSTPLNPTKQPNPVPVAAQNMVVANNSSKINELNKISNVKKQQDTTNNNQQPIIVNNNNGVSGGKSNSGGSVVTAGSSVRNRESTFERVQMQDFWPRVA